VSFAFSLPPRLPQQGAAQLNDTMTATNLADATSPGAIGLNREMSV